MNLQGLSPAIRQYLLITTNYWFFTLTDGALRMLVVLYFYQLGYSPLSIASLFLFYEIFGVVTNLLGGWLGARVGLNNTMNIGLALQVIALGMLAVPAEWLSMVYVMLAQALSGIAKDLNKMSAKSSIKMLVPEGQSSTLYRWVAVLTGSKNALKGVGFFLGGLLLSTLGFQMALLVMAATLLAVFMMSLFTLKQDLGKSKSKPKFTQLFSKSHNINVLSAARLCLFAARDVWFVIALPIYLATVFGWSQWQVGSFLATWVIGYGVVQGLAPRITGSGKGSVKGSEHKPGRNAVVLWAGGLALVPLGIAAGLAGGVDPRWMIILGLMLFGAVFAVNSSLHSYLIVDFAKSDGVSLDIGFYYMANAMGRLLGTILSGWLFQAQGFVSCLLVSGLLLAITCLISRRLAD